MSGYIFSFVSPIDKAPSIDNLNSATRGAIEEALGNVDWCRFSKRVLMDSGFILTMLQSVMDWIGKQIIEKDGEVNIRRTTQRFIWERGVIIQNRYKIL
jgi:hypothetical protein